MDNEYFQRIVTEHRNALHGFACAITVYAEIEMMKVANAEREQRGESLAYPEGAFGCAVNALQEICARM